VAASTGVSVSAAGSLVTAYALSIAIGGVGLGLLTAGRGRRPVLFVSLSITILANVAIVLSDNFAVLIAARIVGGAVHGVFIGAAFAVAVAVVPPERVGRAIAVIVTGFATSTALGVPLGVLLAERWGWHAAFAAVVVVSVLTLAALTLTVPVIRASSQARLGAQARFAFAPRVLAVAGLATVLFAGQYAAFTFIRPFLQEVAGIRGDAIGVYVLCFGVAAAIGTAIGGRLADWSAGRTLIASAIGLVLVLGALLLLGANPVATLMVLVLWGALSNGFVPSVQYLVNALAGEGRDLASVLPASTINLGIALGSVLGAIGYANFAATGPIVFAVVLCCLGVLLAVLTRAATRPAMRA
jgi:DHA1 family inner membrane transport protein